MSDRFIVQLITFLVYSAACILLLYQVKKMPRIAEFVWPVLIYSLHVVIFYSYILVTRTANIESNFSVMVWSGILRLQSGLTIILLLITSRR